MKKKIKTSKAQEEVWEWKEKASEKLNKLSSKKRTEYLEECQKIFLDFMHKRDIKPLQKENLFSHH